MSPMRGQYRLEKQLPVKALLLGVLTLLILAILALSWGQHHFLNKPWIDTSIAAPIKYYKAQDFSIGFIYK